MAAFTYSDYAYDVKNGQPLVGVDVHAIRTDTGLIAVSTTTSATGLYSLAALDTTYDYKIEIRQIGQVTGFHLNRGWAGVNLGAEQALVALATADVNDCSIVIGPGTWIAHGHATARGNAVGNVMNIRIYDGTTEYGGASFVQDVAGAAPGGASRMSCTSSPITVAFGATKTIKLQIYSNTDGALYHTSQFGQITHLRVERIA